MLSNNFLHKSCPFYNTTHLTPIKQSDSAAQLLHFQPLFRYKCSVHSRPFICSSYVPFCYPRHLALHVPPCRSLCLHVKSSCLAVFVAVNLPWPTLLNCSRLYDPPHLCFTPRPTSSSPSPSSAPSPSPSPSPSSPSSSSLPIDLILGLSFGFFAFVLISSILVLTVRNYLRRLHAAPQCTETTVRFTAQAPATPPAPPAPATQQVPPSPPPPPLPPKMKHRIYSNLATPYAVTVLFEKK